MLKVALAQINPAVGDFAGNTKRIIAAIKTARQKGADFVVFGELALSGYPPEDLLLKKHFIDEGLRCRDEISRQAKGIVCFLGCLDRRKNKIYNSCAVLRDAKIEDIYHKIELPNYGVFDEKRYFAPGEEVSTYTYQGYNFAVTICEDIWQPNFASYLKGQRLDFVINLSASPFHLGKIKLRKEVLARAARQSRSFIFYCNLVGGQDELVFDGTSKVVSAAGEPVAVAKSFSEDLLLFNFEKKKHYPAKAVKTSALEQIFQALCLGLADYVAKNGFGQVVLGVSGGIDSAVVAALAVSALGKDKVSALIMPSCYSSPATVADAKKTCDNLGINYRVLNIDGLCAAYQSVLKPLFKNRRPDAAEENIQARIRGNLLMAYSNKFGALVLNTGNKSEVSCGYCTLYGDMVGGFGVLKDVTKGMVYKLAHYLNKLKERKVIPPSVIKRPPSAELRPNQKDSDSLPPYPALDPILKLYIEEDRSLAEIVSQGHNKNTVKKVIALVDFNEYKRRQAPLGVKITPRSFGKDRRMPVTNKFRR